MPGRDSRIDDYSRRGQVDGEEAGRTAIGVLASSDDGLAFRLEVDRCLAELKARAAEMARHGVPAAMVAAYRKAWSGALDRSLDELAAAILPMMPDEGDDDED
ncbi:MAG: hypothetical protein GY837_18600 [Bosea sp.]|nr:hypothetical protein [Bosea sp. (in: a-proteobacteria)]